MKIKNWQKNFLYIIVIIAASFVLFNIAFLLAAAVFNLSANILGASEGSPPPFIGKVVYLVIILLVSWLVFRSRMNNLVKSTVLTMTLMVILVILGISLYQQPAWLTVGSGALIIGIVLYTLYKRKLPWIYYFATIYDAVLALIIIIFRIDI